MASAERIGPGIHLVAGGIAGTVGAVLTCPLEVVKTRLQSSISVRTFNPAYLSTQLNVNSVNVNANSAVTQASPVVRSQLLECLRLIIQNEGYSGLFKGLGPNLIGVAPSRAIYFFTYANVKSGLNSLHLDSLPPECGSVHAISAISAGFLSCTITNPIWLIKTRLQLDQKRDNSLTWQQCASKIRKAHGIPGFWKGITASYMGIAETMIHFVIYEKLKAHLLTHYAHSNPDSKSEKHTPDNSMDFTWCMLAAACSKTTATIIAYPHEVIRTRLREEGTKYKTIKQTCLTVFKEEGMRGLYRGITTQLIRQIPNTAILMATYELVVFLYQRYIHK